MKRLLRSLLLGAILSALLCVGVLAADGEPVKGGIYNINVNTDVTLKPNTEATTDTVDGTEYTDYYANAVKFGVTASGLEADQQYLLLVLKGDASGTAPSVPTADNIAYIDQMAATDTGVTFAAYPKEMTKGTYYVYLVGGGTAFADSQVASFEYDQKFTLGDVNDDGSIDSVDAMKILQSWVGKITLTETQKLAGDVNSDKAVDSVDAMKILQFWIGKISKFN